MHQNTLITRASGFVASIILTGVAFLIIVRPDFFHLTIQVAVIAILILAVLQLIVQAIFFLDLLSEKGPRWNLIFFTSTILMILIIIIGSIWIMNHLNNNMMT